MLNLQNIYAAQQKYGVITTNVAAERVTYLQYLENGFNTNKIIKTLAYMHNF
ncbi:MAG: hypothetical protein LBM93_01655 [Oscillospiraceae bacterium]|jgi:hypothetical protein|nr:hypothetical protein [Oscillospiraceae bacterium]